MIQRVLGVLLTVCISLAGAHAAEPMARLVKKGDFPHIERQAVLMGTEIAILAATTDRAKVETAIDAALAEIKRIEDLMTDWRDDSELMKINHQAGIAPVKIDSEILFVLREAQKISELTEGTFDVTYAGVGKLWGNFVTPPFRVPADDEIKRALPLVGYQNLVLDLKRETAFLKKKGMRVGLGGIAKGYAVDRAAQVMKKAGFNDFALKAGGDLTVRGKKGNELWWVAIQDPRRRDKNIAILPASNASISTSGDYERYFEMNGKRYAHIIDPRTGYPVDHTRSVTVVGKNAYWTDGLAKGAFVLGPEKGLALLERMPDIDGMIVDGEGRIRVTSGLERPAGAPAEK